MARNLRIYALIITCMAISLIAKEKNGAITISFDAPFPTTPYKQMLDLTMHIAGYLHFLQEAPVTLHERELLYDAVAGRITRLWSVTDTFIQEYRQGKPVLITDLEYLLNVLNDTMVTYANSMPHTTYACAEQLLKKVQQRVEELLEGHFRL